MLQPILSELHNQVPPEQDLSFHSEVVKKLIESFYVDDVIIGASSKETIQLYSESKKKILQNGCFNLKKFHISSLSIQVRIDAERFSQRNHQKILGRDLC